MKIKRPYLDLQHFVHHSSVRDSCSVDFLTRRHVRAVNSAGDDIDRWSVWKCLTGTLVVDGRTYVLDEGEVYEVEQSFLSDVDRIIDSIPGVTRGTAAMPRG